MKKLTSLGIKFDPIGRKSLQDEIARLVKGRERAQIGYMNLHGAFLYRRNSRFREFFDGARIVYADGFPVIFWRRLLWGDVSPGMRFSLTNELPDFLAYCRDQEFSVFYIGSEESVVRSGMGYFTRSIPGLKLDGRHGFFDMTRGSTGSTAVLEAIAEARPDILFLGMGMPRQEIWAVENRDLIPAPVVYVCGAAIEYYSGTVAKPPAWLAPLGLTWLFRLFQEPRKLWFRYLVEPLVLIPVMLQEAGTRIIARFKRRPRP